MTIATRLAAASLALAMAARMTGSVEVSGSRRWMSVSKAPPA
jgi:hypothetical protein